MRHGCECTAPFPSCWVLSMRPVLPCAFLHQPLKHVACLHALAMPCLDHKLGPSHDDPHNLLGCSYMQMKQHFAIASHFSTGKATRCMPCMGSVKARLPASSVFIFVPTSPHNDHGSDSPASSCSAPAASQGQHRGRSRARARWRGQQLRPGCPPACLRHRRGAHRQPKQHHCNSSSDAQWGCQWTRVSRPRRCAGLLNRASRGYRARGPRPPWAHGLLGKDAGPTGRAQVR